MNIQPREKRVDNPSHLLDVHSIFRTIQGEGPFCGTPCVFIRLAGCNLQCPACDTQYTNGRRQMAVHEIAEAVNELWRPWSSKPGLVVVTGGEPFRQNLAGLFDVLALNGYYIQVESNGTLPPPQPERGSVWTYRTHVNPHLRSGVYVVCSPKTPKLSRELLEVACALKYVVEHGRVADDGLPLSALRMPNPPARPPSNWDRPVYVQPIDTGNILENDLHVGEAVASCLKHGYTLQLQVHKLVGVE